MAKHRATVPSPKAPDDYTGGKIPTNLPVPAPGPPISVETREVLVSGAKGVRTYAGGEQWLAGKAQYFFYDARRPDVMRYVVELCAGESNALLDVTIDGAPPPDVTKWQHRWYAGTAAGAIDATLAVEDVTWNEEFAGTTVAVIDLYQFDTYWGGKIPNAIWHMQTRKTLKPDTLTNVYSTNGWDLFYDYVRWAEGKALPASRIDTAAFAAAKAADIAAGRDNTCHPLLLEAMDPDDVINMFCLVMSAFYFFDRTTGKYTVVADRPGAAVVATYGDHQGLSGTPVAGTREDGFEKPNKVTVWITDVTNANRPLIPLTTPDPPAGTPIREEEHRLPWIYSATIGNRQRDYIYNALQYDLSIEDVWNDLAAARKLGDIVTLEIPTRGRNFTGRIVQFDPQPDNTFSVRLLEHNEAKFTSTPGSVPAKTPSTFPDPGAVPADVDLLTVTIGPVEMFALQPGFMARAPIVLTNPESTFFDHVDIFVSINGGGYRYDGRAPSGPGQVATYLFNNIVELGVVYSFKFISVSKFDVKSAGVIKTFNVVAPSDPLAPTITTQPQSTTIASGGTTILSVTATAPGGGALTYQWYQGPSGDTSIPLGTANTQSVSPTSARDYWVKVMTVGHATFSVAARVSIFLGITKQPQSITIALGGTATLSVVASPGDVTYAYQWYRGVSDDTSTPIGTGLSTLEVAPTSPTQYWVRVTLGPLVANSSTATVSIHSTVAAGVMLGRRASSGIVEEIAFPTALDNLTVQGADIASAATTNIGAGTGLTIKITGTTTITAFDNVTAGIPRVLNFAGALTLTHNGTSLILPGAANIITAAGDVAIMVSLGSGNWRCLMYMRAAAAPWNATVADAGLSSNVALKNQDNAFSAVQSIIAAMNASLSLLIQNSDAGAASQAFVRLVSDAAALSLVTHASGRTVTRYGITVASWAELVATAGNGLLLGTFTNNAPVVIGTNSIERLRIGGDGHILFGADNTQDFGSTTKRARHAYLARLITGAATPTAAIVGASFGAGGTVAIDTGSSDLGGVITVTAGSGAAALGKVTVTFSTGSAYGTNVPAVIVTPLEGSGGWDQGVTWRLTASSTTAFSIEFKNAAANFTNGSTYKFCYIVVGK
jgi:hypothetical protein